MRPPRRPAEAPKQGGFAMWTKPVIVEVAVGLEINCYACADL